MKKILILIIIVLVGYILYANYEKGPAVQEKATVNGEIMYSCTGGKTVHALFKGSEVRVRFDYEKNMVKLAQATTSPHEYANADKSVIFHVEGDMAGAERNGMMYADCVVAR